MHRYAFTTLAFTLLACADPPCPEGTVATSTERCVLAYDEADAPWPSGDGGAASPDPEPRGYVVVDAPAAMQWIEAGQTEEVRFSASTGPSYLGPLSFELTGLPEGVTATFHEDASGPTLVLEALPDASVGVRSEASLVVTTSDRPDITGEASFEVGVRGARGALDVSFDGDGIRTDVPLDGSRDRVTHVALAPDGTIVVAGDGRADDRRVGFVSWYGPDGVPDRAIADGGSRVIDVLDEENVRTRGLLPTAGGTFVSVEAVSEHVLRLDRDGNVDRRFAIEAPDRPAYLNGGALHPWGDGFLLSFNEQLERYRGDGSLDRTFGEEGVVTTAGSFVSRLARLADGSIVRGTHSVEDGKVFTRFAANGDPHLGFGTGGRVTLAGIRSLYGLVGLDDGGFVFAANDVALSPEDFQGYVTRMTADGTLDGDFGVLGEVAVDDGSGATRGLYGIAVFEERIYGWGIRHVDGEALRGFVVAYDLTGSVDSTFGDGGFLDLGELVLPRTGVVDEEAGRLILGCARPLSPARDATRMVGVVRLWL